MQDNKQLTVCLLFTSPLAREQDKADKICLEFWNTGGVYKTKAKWKYLLYASLI